MTRGPAPKSDRALPVWRGLGLIVVSLAFFIMGCMGLMAWSHQRWDAVLRGSLIPLDRLAESRRHTVAAQLFAERVIAGDPSVDVALVRANLERARHASRELLDGTGLLAGMRLDRPPAPELAAAAAAHLKALDVVGAAVDARLERSTVADPDIRTAHRLADIAANRIETILMGEIVARRAALNRMDAVNIVLVGALTLLLYGLLRRAESRNALAYRALSDNASRLLAFAQGLPGVSFVIDGEGRYHEVFGNDPSLLITPRDGVIGKTLHEIFPREEADRFLSVVKDALTTRNTQRMEYRVTVANEPHWFEARIAPVGTSDQVVWISWDVTERKDADAHVADLTRLYSFLSQVNQSIVFADDRSALFRRICAAAVTHGGFRAAWVEWVSDDRRHLTCVARAGVPLRDEGDVTDLSDDAAWEDSLPATALRQDRIFEFSDLRAVAAPLPWREAALAEGLDGFAVIPVRQEGQPVAALTLVSEHVAPGDSDKRVLLEEVSTDMSFAITQFAREEQRRSAEQRVRLHAAALESTRDGVMVTDLSSHIVSVNRAFTEITGYHELEVLGRNPSMLRSGNHDAAFFESVWASLLAVGHWQGEIRNRRKSGELYSQWMSISTVRDRHGEPTHYVAVLTDITKLKQTEARLHQLAHFDPLTDLPNRLLIGSRLDHALAAAKRSATRVGVLFIDLDNFKNVNDGLGHAVGDDLLKEVARRLAPRLRAGDTLGRLGGDEFLLVLERMTEPQEAAIVAKDLLATLDQPFRLTGGHELYVQASIGISVYPDDGEQASALISDADAAMYQAKRAGRSTYRFYTEALTATANARLMMESRLRRALDQDEFELHYQPVVSLVSGRVIGLEALARLAPPGMDTVSPAVFIPLLEETGLIVALGEWVLRTACRQGRAWHDAGRLPGTLSVNLSPTEIRRGGVDERLQRILEETGFPPDRLELEITESGLMEQGEHAEAFLRSLKRLGVRLSIDDFGTGYSSLAYLKRFPVDKLKIDRSFIRDIPDDPSDMRLTETIIALARGLQLTVVAEGVETEAQRTFLAIHDCDAYQGYFFSPAVPAAQLEARFLPG